MTQRDLVTIETFAEHLEGFGTLGMLGYLDANKDLVVSLKKILDQSKDFKELKDQLISLCNERDSFINHANNHIIT